MSLMKCYNQECQNQVDYEQKNSAFCSEECKASYYGTTVDNLNAKPKVAGSKRTLEEWISFFRSGEAKSLYQERAKGVKIAPEEKK